MMKLKPIMKRRIVSALSLTTLFLAAGTLLSDAPLRVQLVHACIVVIVFTIPALWIGSWDDILKRWWIPACAGIIGGLAWELGGMATIRKYEFIGVGIYLWMMIASVLTLSIHGATSMKRA